MPMFRLFYYTCICSSFHILFSHLPALSRVYRHGVEVYQWVGGELNASYYSISPLMSVRQLGLIRQQFGEGGIK